MDIFGRRLHSGAFISVVILVALPLVTSYNVLILMPVGSRSHKNVLDPIAEELGKRGHKVTIFSSYAEKTNPAGVENVRMRIADLIHGGMHNVSFFSSQLNMLSFSNLVYMHQGLCDILNFTYTDPFVVDVIRNPRRNDSSPRYDVVIVNAIVNEFVLPLANHIGAPVVVVSPTMMLPILAWVHDIPNPAYVPGPMMFLDGTGRMTFWQRFVSAAMNFFFIQMHLQLQLPSFDGHVHRFLPNAPPIRELLTNVSFVMSNSHPAIHPSSPTMPYYVQIGGIHCRPAKKLPKYIEDFMQSSGDFGVIYLSFGSIQRGEDVPEDMKAKFLEVFAKLPQKVLWKYEGNISDLPSNVKLVAWAPQQDILGHPKVRLFITHGGGLSIQETIYHGTPAVAFPLGVEQASNVNNAVRLGLAEYMDWKIFGADDLLQVVRKVLTDRRYKENAVAASSRFRDRIRSPAEEAAYWVEYVVRHNGARHLKSGAATLNFFQYFMLDIMLAILIAGSIVFMLAVLVQRKLVHYSSIFGRKFKELFLEKRSSVKISKLKKN